MSKKIDGLADKVELTLAQKEIQRFRLLLSIGHNIWDDKLERRTFDLEQFEKFLLTLHVTDDKDDTPVVCNPLRNEISARKKDDYTHAVGLFLDINNDCEDEAYLSMDEARQLVKKSGSYAFVYHTYSSSKEKHKLRIFFPFKEPYPLKTDAQKGNFEAYRRAMLLDIGLPVGDATADRFTQVFYIRSAHPENKDVPDAYVNKTEKLLDWREYKSEVSTSRLLDSINFDEPDPLIFEGVDLRKWYALCGRAFDRQKAVERNKPEMLTKDHTSDGKGIILAECPFEEFHSSHKDNSSRTALYKTGFNCFGNHCHKSRGQVDVDLRMLEQGWIKLADILDPTIGGSGIDAMELAKQADAKTTLDECSSILRVAIVNADEAEILQVKNHLVAVTKIAKIDMNALLKTARSDVEGGTGRQSAAELEEIVNEIVLKMNEDWAMLSGLKDVTYVMMGPLGLVELKRQAFLSKFENVFFDYDGERHYVAPLWLKHPLKREATEKVFMPYAYGSPDPTTKSQINTFTGWAVEPVKGDWSLMRAHLFENMYRGNEEWFNWRMAWNAHIVQMPHEKEGSSCTTMGEKGTGKSIFEDHMRALFGIHGMVVADDELVTGRFNSHLDTIIFMQLEEAIWVHDHKAESMLKHNITGQEQASQPKGVDVSQKLNFTRYVSTANASHTTPATAGERRFFVMRCKATRQKDTAYFKAIVDQMRNGGLEAMFYDLLHLDWTPYDLRNPPETPWLESQKEQSLELVPEWLLSVLNDGWFADELDMETFEQKELSMDAMTRVPVATVKEHYRQYAKESPKRVEPFKRVIDLLSDHGIVKKKGADKDDRKWAYEFPPLKELCQTFYRINEVHVSKDEEEV